MPIVMTPSPELRVPVPTVGGIYLHGNQQSVHTERYIHCDGTRLKLADSNFGQEQYHHTDYYTWNSRSGEQILFIFPTRVSLTTITLHYYSDSVRGRPRLRFYIVRDGFDIWDTPVSNIPRVDVASVPPGGEPAGRRSVSINANFNTRKVLMYKYSSSFSFALSEMEFNNSTCTCPCPCKCTACTILSL